MKINGRESDMAFYIFPQAIPKEQCKEHLGYCLDNLTFQNAVTIKPGGSAVGTEGDRSKYIEERESVRKTSISFLREEDRVLNQLVWGFIKEANRVFFKYRLDYFQPIQFAKYQNGGHYDWHQDSTTESEDGDTRKLSLTFSMTDGEDYEGGLLQFYNGNRKYTDDIDNNKRNIEDDIKKVGSVIVFDSRDWHRVTPVTGGVRYSLVCWTVGPQFI